MRARSAAGSRARTARRRDGRRRRGSRGAAVDEHAGVDGLAALDARDDPQHRVLEGVSGHRSHRGRSPRRRAHRGPAATASCNAAPHSSRAASRAVRPAGRPPARPAAGSGRANVGHLGQCGRDQRRPRARRRRRRRRPPSRTCSPASYGRGGGGRRGPVVVEDQRGAVVDQPGPAVPQQHVRVAPGAVDVADERVEPQHPAGERGSTVERSGSGSSAPGRKSTPRLRPALARSRSWTSSSGSPRPAPGRPRPRPGRGPAARAPGRARRRSPRRPAPAPCPAPRNFTT